MITKEEQADKTVRSFESLGEVLSFVLSNSHCFKLVPYHLTPGLLQSLLNFRSSPLVFPNSNPFCTLKPR